MYLLFDFWVPAAIFPLCGHLACRIPKGISIAFHTSLAQHHHPGKCIHKPQKMNGYNMNIPNVINKYIYIYICLHIYIHTHTNIYIYTYMHTCMPICHQPAQLGAPAWPCSTSALRWFCAQISTNAWIPVSSAWQRLTGDQLSLRKCHTSWSKWTSTLKKPAFYMFFKPPNG
jgi:hypothetical protein